MNETPAGNVRPQMRAGDRDRLDSWKKIAAHFNRDVTTVQRWERRESMPVHRHVHDKQGSVYAFRSELDTWWGNRSKLPDSTGLDVEPLAESAAETPSSSPSSTEFEKRPGRSRNWAVIGSAALLVLLVTYLELRHDRPATQVWRDPLANSTITRLTDWPGFEQAAEISRDGRWSSFLSDHDGHIDAWLTEIGSGSYRKLSQGEHVELVNPSIRTLGFSADGSFVTVWTRSADGSHSDDIKLMAASLSGGGLHEFLPAVAEAAWSSDGRQMVYHTTAPGDPLFVVDARGATKLIYTAPPGVHCHFPLWSRDDAYVYFVRGTPPERWDLWRIHPSGTGLERVTFHDSHVSHPVLLDADTLLYLADDLHGSGPWLYALNLGEKSPHRISFGLERYTSLSASAGGTRLLATIDDSQSDMWSTSLAQGAAENDQQSSLGLSLVTATAFSPRAGPDYILYVSARAGRQGIWKAAGDQSRELWSGAPATLVGAPALSKDGRQIAFTASDGERTVLYIMDSEGNQVHALSSSLRLRGSPAWSPDGRSIVIATIRDGEPRLISIYTDGRAPSPLVSEYSIDPAWSPDGRYLIYSGADVGTTFPVRAVAPDGRPFSITPLILTRGARRAVFLPDSDSVVLLRGELGHKNFWLVNLHTGVERQITHLPPDIAINDFDVSNDGSKILFDRLRESSKIALIERGT